MTFQGHVYLAHACKRGHSVYVKQVNPCSHPIQSISMFSNTCMHFKALAIVYKVSCDLHLSYFSSSKSLCPSSFSPFPTAPPPNILHKQHHFYNWSTHLHITITYWRAELRGEGCRMKRKHSHNFLKPFLFIFRKPLPPFKGHLTSQTSRSVFQVSELIASVWSSSPSQLQPSHIVITLIVHVHPRMSPPFWFLFYGCN